MQSIISEFDAISLDEMDNVKLMSRVDTKFAFSQHLLVLLLKRLKKHYQILEISGKRIHVYKSLYYDTDDRKFYIDHHNQRVDRNKVRFREYVESGLSFLEIKLKNNKGKTIKKRMKVDKISTELTEKHQQYINKIIGDSIELHSQQWINFNRLTFVHKVHKERLTMDINLSFRDKDKSGMLNELVIAEVKQEKMSRSSDFMRIAKEMSILPIRMSKYCISTAELEPTIKKNRFKKKLLFINKIKKL